jgi:RHS repeat-associated protein
MGNLDTEAGASGNLTARSWDLQPRKFFYNLLSERVAADNSLVYYGWTYDNAGRPSEYYDMWGGHPFQYDAAGNLTNMFGSVGYVTTYTYDSLNHMTTASVERPGVDSSPQLAATLTYDSLGRRSLVTFADNSTQAYTYDNADRPLTIAHTFPGSGSGDPGDAVTYTYAYDAAGRDTSKTITNPLGTLDPGYVFTASGGAAPASTYAAANTVNQYATVNGQTYTYWQEGQMYWDGIPARAYDYDELGSMIWATKSSTDYANTPVDALGRPIWRQKMNPGGTDTFIYYGTSGLGPEEITEVVFDAPDPATSWTNRGWRYYLPGPAPDERLAFVDTNNVVYYPHIDRQGSTIAVSNAGYAVAKHAYGPYGETPDPVIEDVPASSGAAVGAEAYPFRYTGQRLHSDYGLYDYKARNYNPVIGQFLQPDPIGFGGGMNFYGYVGDDPTNETDPTGTEGNHADNGNGSTMPDAMDEENLSVWKGTQVYKAIEDERSGTSGDSLSKLSTATGESSQSIAKNDPSPSDVVAAAIATAASPQTDEIVVTAEKAPLDVAQCGFCHTDNQSLPVRPPLRCQFMPCFPGRDWKIPRPAPVTSSKADRAEALKRCREKCAREVGQGKWGPRGIGGSAVPSNLRKCVRNCLEAEGYRDY